jgi:lipopolysaccharide export system protein LptA
VAWWLAAQAMAAGGNVKIVVAPLEVHASGGALSGTAHAVRRALVERIGAQEGLTGEESPKGKDITAVTLSPAALQSAARDVNAQYVLYGSLTQIGTTYSLDARLYDPASGRSKGTFFREGAGEEDLLAKVGGMAQDVKRTLQAPAVAAAPAEADTGQGQVSGAPADTSRAGVRGTGGPAGALGLRVGEGKKPIAITSDSLEALNKQNTVVFRGNVEAKQSDLRIYCDVMTVLYSPDGKGIVRIVADRHVRIIHEPAPKAGEGQEKITATCQRGVYYNNAGKIVLTGDPVVTRGPDTVRGDEITVFFDENRFTVRQAKVTITPEGARALNQRGVERSAAPSRSD